MSKIKPQNEWGGKFTVFIAIIRDFLENHTKQTTKIKKLKILGGYGARIQVKQ